MPTLSLGVSVVLILVYSANLFYTSRRTGTYSIAPRRRQPSCRCRSPSCPRRRDGRGRRHCVLVVTRTRTPPPLGISVFFPRDRLPPSATPPSTFVIYSHAITDGLVLSIQSAQHPDPLMTAPILVLVSSAMGHPIISSSAPLELIAIAARVCRQLDRARRDHVVRRRLLGAVYLLSRARFFFMGAKYAAIGHRPSGHRRGAAARAVPGSASCENAGMASETRRPASAAPRLL